MKVTVSCQHERCGRMFWAEQADVARGGAKFCSRSCSARARDTLARRLEDLIVRCRQGHAPTLEDLQAVMGNCRGRRQVFGGVLHTTMTEQPK